MLTADRIKEQLHTKWAACNIIYKEVTGSTNDDARELAREGAASGTLVVADAQTSGRGSHQRGWETPAHDNIAMSLIVRPGITSDRISMLTLVMGLSVAEGCERAAIESGLKADKGTVCEIKWPNDVIVSGRKICGILSELHMSPDGRIEDVVIGVGINVNMADFPEEIRGVAGSLLTQTGIRADRSLVVARVMERFEENYARFESTGDISLLKRQYEERLVNLGKRVLLIDAKRAGVVADAGEVEKCFSGNENEQGVALGVNNTGALMVRLDDGTIREVNAGEVSVRGIYGYI